MPTLLTGAALAGAGRCLAGLARRLRADPRGVAAVEFAMIVPVMFFLFVGSIEFSQALTVDRRVTQAASSSADLIARAPAEGFANWSEVEGQLKIVEQLMEPYDVSKLTVNVISVKAKINPANPTAVTYVVTGSRNNHGASTLACGDPYTTIPTGLLAAGESVIVAEATYNYTPLIFKYFITSAFDLEEKFYLKPRNSSCVSMGGVNCVTAACAN